MTISYHRLSETSTDLPPRRRIHKVFIVAGAMLWLTFFLLQGLGWLVASRAESITDIAEGKPPSTDPVKLRSANESLQRKIRGLAPKGPYIVIDTAGNRVFLRQGEATLREMVASCGSGNVLEDPVGGRRWVFETPRGEFQVRSKVIDPIWIKPDWAFIEEGEPIPAKSSERAEPGMMGDYALGLGRGYFIHGTMYKRLLGRNVSHGCVRLGDDDLKHLFEKSPIGTRVMIF
ncbi:MAG TPA: L,D-transpeptidase [Desulfuromonas sp.]|nr:L,D-transpeptidase [Desulfuromonas sp.]HBT82725.1 L,D-transpeptidase [Desulfuromonas sp.]